MHEGWQERESRRQKTIEKATLAAMSIVNEENDGSEEETYFLMAKVAEQFLKSALVPLLNGVHRKDLHEDAQQRQRQP